MSGRGSVYQRGTTWTAHVKWSDGSGSHQLKRGGFRLKRHAEAHLVEMLGTIDHGTAVPVSRLTVAAYLTGWCTDRQHRLAPSTLKSYRDKMRHYVIPAIGDLRLQALDVGHLDQLWRDLAAPRPGRRSLSARTIRYTYTIVRTALADAERRGIVVRNVADRSSPPSAKSAKAPKFSTWTAAELGAFLDFIHDYSMSAAITLAAMTGLRRGELVALAWSHVDLDAGTLHVVEAASIGDDGLHVGTPKTERSRREVELDDDAVAVLHRHRLEQVELRLLVGAGWRDHGLVFPRPDGTMMHPDIVSQQFDRLVARSGQRRIRLHDLRHSHATQLVDAGVDPKTVSDRLGHSSVAFTLDTYVKARPGRQREAAAAVSALIRAAQQP